MEELPIIIIFDQNGNYVGGIPNNMMMESENIIMDIYGVLLQLDRVRE